MASDDVIGQNSVDAETLPRRAFVAAAASAAAGAGLPAMAQEKSMPAKAGDYPDGLDLKKLKEVSGMMIDAITSKPFVVAMLALKAAKPADRLTIGAKLLAPEALIKQGVVLPKDMRITSRYFETGHPVIDVNDYGSFLGGFNPAPRPEVAGGCACAGAATICGGAGVS